MLTILAKRAEANHPTTWAAWTIRGAAVLDVALVTLSVIALVALIRGSGILSQKVAKAIIGTQLFCCLVVILLVMKQKTEKDKDDRIEQLQQEVATVNGQLHAATAAHRGCSQTETQLKNAQRLLRENEQTLQQFREHVAHCTVVKFNAAAGEEAKQAAPEPFISPKEDQKLKYIIRELRFVDFKDVKKASEVNENLIKYFETIDPDFRKFYNKVHTLQYGTMFPGSKITMLTLALDKHYNIAIRHYLTKYSTSHVTLKEAIEKRMLYICKEVRIGETYRTEIRQSSSMI